jgi:uncharacterized protein
MQALPKIGVGLAYQAPLRSMIEDSGAGLDFVEVVPDMLWTDFGPGHSPRHLDDFEGIALLDRIRRDRLVVAHSIGLSIGSAHRFDVEHIAQIHRWHERFCFPWHSDHLAYHMAEHAGREMNVGITLPLARDRQTLDLLIPRVREVQRRIPAPFLLENNVYYFDIPDAEMAEADFLNALCHESGCGLLLDLHNVYTNARNHGTDPWTLLSAIDLVLVGEIHVAGGMALDGFYLDAHSDTVPEPVWELLDWTLPRCPNIGGVVFEIFGSWVEPVGMERIQDDLRRLQRLWSRHQTTTGANSNRALEETSTR